MMMKGRREDQMGCDGKKAVAELFKLLDRWDREDREKNFVDEERRRPSPLAAGASVVSASGKEDGNET